ncbi:hypothetical protein ACIBH1_32765 [Nonomuraea sp. NPDC050663]|uniref:hypothetical protein n=1 Tax=Nonomuraea sp. NPDC050663 TaxID=3364370 RepID=UPI0037AE2F65
MADRRVLLFSGVVAVMVAVGVYLTVQGTSGPEEPAAGRTGEPTAVVAGGPSRPLATATDKPFEIYDYLPVAKDQLAAAADLAERFTAAYGTFRYDEDPAAYAARVKTFTTGGLGDVLTRTLTSPGTVERNRDDQVVSQGTGKLKGIRTVERNSVVFVINGTQQRTTKNGASAHADDYAVTVTRVGSDWRVFDLQPATEGQDGDAQG